MKTKVLFYLRNRHLVVGDTERCSSCDKQLLTRAFYIFPCQHAFHSNCLYREVRVLLSDAQRVEADKLQQVFKLSFNNLADLLEMFSCCFARSLCFKYLFICSFQAET